MESEEKTGLFKDISFKDWTSDAFGGLAAMLVALPQAIAFGVVIFSALGPGKAAEGALAGLMGAAVIGIVAPLFGGAPRLISGPCAPAAAVMAALAAELAAGPAANDPSRLVLLLSVAALISGALQILYGTLGGGRIIKYIPYPVVTGYLSGVAVLIFLGQMPKVFGLKAGASLLTGLASPSVWRWPALLVGASSMAATAAASKLTKKVPGPIIGLAGGMLAYLAASFFEPGLRTLSGNSFVVGPIGGGASGLGAHFSAWAAAARLGMADLHAILVPALTLSVLLSMDTLKTCVAVDAVTRSRHDSNRELLGQGLANIGSALLGGIPGAGTSGATLVNVQSGGKTRLSGVFEGVFALLVFLLLSGLIAWVPLAALAGILIVVAWRMFDRNSFGLLRKRSTLFDFVVTASVVATAIATDLMTAAGVGLGLSILLFIREQIQSSVIRRKSYGNHVFSKQRRLPEEMEVLEREGGRTVICELQGTLFFGTTDQLLSELSPDIKGKKVLILDMRRVQSLDFTAVHMLRQMEEDLRSRGGRILLCDLPVNLPSGQDLQAYFDAAGLVTPAQGAMIFDELDGALAWAEDRILEEAGLGRGREDVPIQVDHIHLFRELEPELREALVSSLQERSCRANEVVFRHGETGDEMFIVRRGKVRIVMPSQAGHSHHLATFGRGDFFGDMAFVERSARSADAFAVEDTDLYVLSRTRFNEAVYRQPILGIRLFARIALTLSSRLRQTDKELWALQDS